LAPAHHLGGNRSRPLTAEIARIDTALAESGCSRAIPPRPAALAKARADHAAALAKAEENGWIASAIQESVIEVSNQTRNSRASDY